MLSVLIPVYNYDITNLLQVLHKQCINAGIPFEIVVIDDKSDTFYVEKNKTVAAQLNFKFIKNEVNLGRTQSRKLLAQAALYDKLLFLDADVLPVTNDFIATYIKVINKAAVILGGIAYKTEPKEPNTVLRLKYGIEREAKSAQIRSLNPYGNILSANLLIDKHVFLENNFSGETNLYGLDIYFAYNLYIKQVTTLHINNPVYHIGLESNEIFFQKSLNAVKSRKDILLRKKGIENINSLLKHYKKLKKYRLTTLVAFGFKIVEPILKRKILNSNPNLFYLDLYRLGYICSLKN
ncbi:glycosyltransferase family 2 protein [Flavobacterium rakeshii]|uniref:glycosyltransferase family 2 protein n=1 Tax=Flavobacterium rakeshii TaxID=1038845 RepID=UPI002E7C4F9F|nr:glycosyltransferase family 2 protein [Flavobacterium rakeshii]MEE1898995.1 glycosyltransferase family 2 protein [Flavobacterium rakeshii]